MNCLLCVVIRGGAGKGYIFNEACGDGLLQCRTGFVQGVRPGRRNWGRSSAALAKGRVVPYSDRRAAVTACLFHVSKQTFSEQAITG